MSSVAMGTSSVLEVRGKDKAEVQVSTLYAAGEQTNMGSEGSGISSEGDKAQIKRRYQRLEELVPEARSASTRTERGSDSQTAAA